MPNSRFLYVPSYEGMYSVSDLGNVWSHKSEMLMSQCTDGDGYLQLGLRKNRKQTSFRVHRLIMLAFKGASNLQVNHMNGIKTDNRLINLEYCDHRHNIAHAVSTGLRDHKGERNWGAKLAAKDVVFIRENMHILAKDIMLKFDISKAQVSSIRTRRTWKHIL